MAFALAAVPAFVLLFAMAWSGAHCEPVPECQRQNELYFGLLMLVVLVIAGGAGIAVSKIINRLAKNREDEGTSALFVVASTGSALLITGILLWGFFKSLGATG